MNYNLFNYSITIIIVQKKAKKASILIWSIFLSMIISISFITISSKINKNLIRDSSLDSNVYNIIKEKIVDNNFSEEETKSWDKIVFENDSYIERTLKKMEKYIIIFPKETQVNIEIINGWPIYYSNSGEINIVWTWIIDTNLNFLVETWSLEINNLWWLTSFSVNWNKDFIAQDKKYEVIKKIWNKDFIKTSWEIKLIK